MSSELKRYLDHLANGPLLDPVVPVKHLYLYAEEGKAVDESELVKRRIGITARHRRYKPLVVRRARKY